MAIINIVLLFSAVLVCKHMVWSLVTGTSSHSDETREIIQQLETGFHRLLEKIHDSVECSHLDEPHQGHHPPTRSIDESLVFPGLHDKSSKTLLKENRRANPFAHHESLDLPLPDAHVQNLHKMGYRTTKNPMNVDKHHKLYQQHEHGSYGHSFTEPTVPVLQHDGSVVNLPASQTHQVPTMTISTDALLPNMGSFPEEQIGTFGPLYTALPSPPPTIDSEYEHTITQYIPHEDIEKTWQYLTREIDGQKFKVAYRDEGKYYMLVVNDHIEHKSKVENGEFVVFHDTFNDAIFMKNVGSHSGSENAGILVNFYNRYVITHDGEIIFHYAPEVDHETETRANVNVKDNKYEWKFSPDNYGYEMLLNMAPFRLRIHATNGASESLTITRKSEDQMEPIHLGNHDGRKLSLMHVNLSTNSLDAKFEGKEHEPESFSLVLSLAAISTLQHLSMRHHLRIDFRETRPEHNVSIKDIQEGSDSEWKKLERDFPKGNAVFAFREITKEEKSGSSGHDKYGRYLGVPLLKYEIVINDNPNSGITVDDQRLNQMKEAFQSGLYMSNQDHSKPGCIVHYNYGILITLDGQLSEAENLHPLVTKLKASNHNIENPKPAPSHGHESHTTWTVFKGQDYSNGKDLWDQVIKQVPQFEIILDSPGSSPHLEIRKNAATIIQYHCIDGSKGQESFGEASATEIADLILNKAQGTLTFRYRHEPTRLGTMSLSKDAVNFLAKYAKENLLLIRIDGEHNISAEEWIEIMYKPILDRDKKVDIRIKARKRGSAEIASTSVYDPEGREADLASDAPYEVVVNDNPKYCTFLSEERLNALKELTPEDYGIIVAKPLPGQEKSSHGGGLIHFERNFLVTEEKLIDFRPVNMEIHDNKLNEMVIRHNDQQFIYYSTAAAPIEDWLKFFGGHEGCQVKIFDNSEAIPDVILTRLHRNEPIQVQGGPMKQHANGKSMNDITDLEFTAEQDEQHFILKAHYSFALLQAASAEIPSNQVAIRLRRNTGLLIQSLLRGGTVAGIAPSAHEKRRQISNSEWVYEPRPKDYRPHEDKVIAPSENKIGIKWRKLANGEAERITATGVDDEGLMVYNKREESQPYMVALWVTEEAASKKRYLVSEKVKSNLVEMVDPDRNKKKFKFAEIENDHIDKEVILDLNELIYLTHAGFYQKDVLDIEIPDTITEHVDVYIFENKYVRLYNRLLESRDKFSIIKDLIEKPFDKPYILRIRPKESRDHYLSIVVTRNQGQKTARLYDGTVQHAGLVGNEFLLTCCNLVKPLLGAPELVGIYERGSRKGQIFRTHPNNDGIKIITALHDQANPDGHKVLSIKLDDREAYPASEAEFCNNPEIEQQKPRTFSEKLLGKSSGKKTEKELEEKFIQNGWIILKRKEHDVTIRIALRQASNRGADSATITMNTKQGTTPEWELLVLGTDPSSHIVSYGISTTTKTIVEDMMNKDRKLYPILKTSDTTNEKLHVVVIMNVPEMIYISLNHFFELNHGMFEIPDLSTGFRDYINVYLDPNFYLQWKFDNSDDLFPIKQLLQNGRNKPFSLWIKGHPKSVPNYLTITVGSPTSAGSRPSHLYSGRVIPPENQGDELNCVYFKGFLKSKLAATKCSNNEHIEVEMSSYGEDVLSYFATNPERNPMLKIKVKKDFQGISKNTVPPDPSSEYCSICPAKGSTASSILKKSGN